MEGLAFFIERMEIDQSPESQELCKHLTSHPPKLA